MVSGSMSVVTPVGSARSETRTCPPMVSALMSASIAEGMAVGRALMASVNICCSTSPSPCCTSIASPTRTIGTSAAMTSSRRTMMKSTWVTVCATGWRCISRARARYVPEPVSRDSSWLAPASLFSATRSSRATMATGSGSVPWP